MREIFELALLEHDLPFNPAVFEPNVASGRVRRQTRHFGALLFKRVTLTYSGPLKAEHLRCRKQDMIFHHLRAAGGRVISGGKIIDGRTAPPRWREGVFDAFHGQWNTTPGAAAVTPRVPNVGITVLDNEADSQDANLVDWMRQQLQGAPTDRPMHAFAGLFAPHMDYHAPQWCFDLYDPKDFVVPSDFSAMDNADIPDFIRRFQLRRSTAPGAGAGGDWRANDEGWRNSVWGNFALTSWADHLFGQILALWEQSPFAADGAVSILSDHGFHLGDYWTWFKFTSFSPSCGLPMIWRGPGQTTPRSVSKPVSTLDHFQTLCDYGGVGGLGRPAGTSLRPLIDGTGDANEHYAVTHVFGSASALLEADPVTGDYQSGGTIYRVTEYADRSVVIWDNEADWFNVNPVTGNNSPRDARLLERLHEQCVLGGFGYPDTPAGAKRRASVIELRDEAERTALKGSGGSDQVFTHGDLAEGSDLGEGYDFLWFLADQGGTITMPPGANAAFAGAEAPLGSAGAASVTVIANVMGNSLDNLIDAGRPSQGDIFGWAGDDHIIGGTRLYGGAGDDLLESYWLGNEMHGGPGNDTLLGGDGGDLLDGGPGDDRIVGGSGNDTILGGPGDDWIEGGPGNDRIDTGPGDDIVKAGPGNDTVIASGGANDIDLGTGNDTLIVKRCEATQTLRSFTAGDVIDLTDWAALGPVAVTARGVDVWIEIATERIRVVGADTAAVTAAIIGASVA